MPKQPATKTCFIVSPIGEEDSRTRRKADYVLRRLIWPALKPLGFAVPKRIDQLHKPDDIKWNIIEELERATLVVADLTGVNPNVMYEMGIRQAWSCPCIPIAPKGTKLPFDASGTNTVFYPRLDARISLSAKHERKAVTLLRKHARQLFKRSWQTRFAEVMQRFGQKSSMDAVYRTMQRAMTSLSESLRDLLKEIDNSPKLKKKFLRSARRPFTTLEHRLLFLEEALNSGNERVLDETCQRLCEQIARLQKRGNRLIGKLKVLKKKPLKGKKLQRFRQKIIEQLSTLVRMADKIRDRIDKEALPLQLG